MNRQDNVFYDPDMDSIRMPEQLGFFWIFERLEDHYKETRSSFHVRIYS